MRPGQCTHRPFKPHIQTHTHTALPVRPLPALLSVAPPKQVTRKSSPERNSLPFLPPFVPNEPLSLCTCVTRCPRATRTTFTHAHYRFYSPPPTFRLLHTCGRVEGAGNTNCTKALR